VASFGKMHRACPSVDDNKQREAARKEDGRRPPLQKNRNQARAQMSETVAFGRPGRRHTSSDQSDIAQSGDGAPAKLRERRPTRGPRRPHQNKTPCPRVLAAVTHKIICEVLTADPEHRQASKSESLLGPQRHHECGARRRALRPGMRVVASRVSQGGWPTAAPEVRRKEIFRRQIQRHFRPSDPPHPAKSLLLRFPFPPICA